jgi:RluA family pseudouridine synthase
MKIAEKSIRLGVPADQETALPVILFQNESLFVINKPAGIAVHAGSGGGQTIEDFLPLLDPQSNQIPHLAHRLDRDTSGCLIIGRTKQALRQMGRLFEQGRVQKIYWAIVKGSVKPKQGRIALPLAKKTSNKNQWHMCVDHSDGQEAITDYQVMGSDDTYTWLALRPKTGRTHQLRVHCAEMGWPILGDRFYDLHYQQDDPNLMLHASQVIIPFRHPNESSETPPLRVTAPPPLHMHEKLHQCGWKE